ncbi:MAG: hypothetical protein ACYS14_01925 [Planctomycetota bacterium]|jgi:hypothetical protein
MIINSFRIVEDSDKALERAEKVLKPWQRGEGSAAAHGCPDDGGLPASNDYILPLYKRQIDAFVAAGGHAGVPEIV